MSRLARVAILGLVLVGLATAIYIGCSRLGCGNIMMPKALASPIGSSDNRHVSLEKAIQILQPRTTPKRAARLAAAIRLESLINGLEPKLVLALAMRESSLHPLVEVGRIRGPRGEIGLMQIMPSGLAMSFRPRKNGRPCNLKSAWCSVATATRYLRHLRERCGGSKWVWVGAYSSRSCPSERLARKMRGVKTVQQYYSMIGGS